MCCKCRHTLHGVAQSVHVIISEQALGISSGYKEACIYWWHKGVYLHDFLSLCLRH